MKLLIKILTRGILPLLIIGGGVVLAGYLIETSPKAKRQQPPRRDRLVEVIPVAFTDQRVVVEAMGTVMPSREVELQPRVSGHIVEVSAEFVPGGHFKAGDKLIQIDPSDFQLAVQQRESDLAQAQSKQEMELGQQAVAKREFEMLRETVKEDESSLVLRQPQLAQARAAVAIAQAALDQARLNLERTTVRAPFNTIIRERQVNLGMQVTPSTTLATLTGTDTYWIEVAVPVDDLQWLEIPKSANDAGSTVRVYNEAAWGKDGFREGRVIRLMTDLEKEGRMARLLVEVRDPDAMLPENKSKPRLLLDAYVRVELAGIEVKSVAALPRRYVRDGNTVWVMTADKKLEIRPVEIVYRGRENLFVRDSLKTGERIVTTDIAAPVPGMSLRTDEDNNQPGKPNKSERVQTEPRKP